MARSPSHHAPSLRELRHAHFVAPGPPVLGEIEAALRAAVIADPDSNAPRLNYAAWCDSHGDERGEFIRLQMETLKSQARLDREADLLARHGRHWCWDLDPWSAKDIVFRCGFAESLSLAGRAFLHLGEGLFRTAPIRDVRLVAIQPYMGELAACPLLARLRRLDLAGNALGSAAISELLTSPFCQVEALDISGNALGDAGLRELASPLRKFRELGLRSNSLTFESLEAILESSRLESLALSDNHMSLAILPRLASLAPSLRTLQLARCGLGSVPCDTSRFPHLENLDLSHNDLEDLDVGGSPIRTLKLRGNRLTGCRLPKSLTSLDLAGNPLGDAGLDCILGLDNLRSLDVGNCQITDRGIERLLQTDRLEGLRNLSLAWNRCGDTAVAALARSPQAHNLRSLDLTGTAITFRGAIALAESPNLTSLRSLVLGQSLNLPDDVAAMLRERFS